MKTLLATLFGLAMVPAMAAPTPPPGDLPAADAVVRALAAHPAVRAAQAEVRGAEAEQARLKAGEYEYGLRLATQRRAIEGGPTHQEWSAGLERGLRLTGKADLDARIGEQGVLEAGEKVGDARHEAARQLLGLWYGARSSALETRLWREQGRLLEGQMRIVETRVKRGDAARLDTYQAEAALVQARSQAAAAEAREKAALAELATRFPELPAPAESEALPVLPEGDAASWLAHTLEHNHELLAASRALEKARLLVRRAEADQRPDPTLGLHLASEQGGKDRIVGISVALPLPGEGRRAQADLRLAQAQVQAEMEAATRRRLTAEAGANWQRAAAGVESWRRLEEAAQAIGRHADLARRANALGELGLSDTLLARRAALDARLAAGQARLAANEAIARLLLDAHRLWPLGDDDEHH